MAPRTSWPIDEARAKVLELAQQLPAEESTGGPETLNQALAETIHARMDSPPFTKSLMDGYALRADDGVLPRVVLAHMIAAGQTPTTAVTVGPGETVRIFTGAPLPKGADTVAMQEHTKLDTDGRLLLNSPLKQGQNVLKRGEEFRYPDAILPRGTVITPAICGLLATLGHHTVRVTRRAEVAIVSSGNEIVEVGEVEAPDPGQIFNSNGPMLAGLVAMTGAIAHYLGIARDDETALTQKLNAGLESADVLLVSGGVSVGDFDLVPNVLAKLGVKTHFHSVTMKPGKPLLFGTLGQKLVFGLPGNPVSAFVGYQVFVRPAIQALMGLPRTEMFMAKLNKDHAANHDRPTFEPAVLQRDGLVTPLPWFGSANLRALEAANAFVRLPAGSVTYKSGDLVPVLPMD